MVCHFVAAICIAIAALLILQAWRSYVRESEEYDQKCIEWKDKERHDTCTGEVVVYQ